LKLYKYRIAIILLGLVGYSLTVARSLSFWDCGEYIAAANVLGIPHPPGNPLFVLLGRVFILLFGWISGPAFAVNLVSAISSIVCCLLIFEIVILILPKQHIAEKASVSYPCNALLAFFAASVSLFGDTFWFNAVEAGAYGISIMVIMLEIWAALKWKELSTLNSQLSTKYLFLIIYIAFLGLGFHTFCLLPLPAIFIFVLIHKRKFPVKFFFAAAFLVVLGLSSQLYLPVRSSTEPILNENNPAEWSNFKDVVSRKQYGNMSMFERALYRRGSVSSQFGFSENTGYLGYHLNQWLPAPLGAQVVGSWETGEKLQFLHRIVFQFLIIAVFVGVWVYRKRAGVVLITAMFFLSSVGLVLYLNLADGTRIDSYSAKQWNIQIKEIRKFVPDSIPNLPSLGKLNSLFSFYFALPEEMRGMWLKEAPRAEGLRTIFAWEAALAEQGIRMANPPRAIHREVRNRDYFFTPAFLFFAIMAAVACNAGVQRLKSERAQKLIAFALAFAWVVPFAGNFYSHNRSKDFIARDFAMNILNSVPENGILITYGDNDTFPLWYMQMVENYRTDVVVINETLSYGDWYCEQILKQYPELLEQVADGNFVHQVIENNWPERSVNFMIGASPEDYAQYSENVPLIGLVRNLGMEGPEADSLLLANLTKNYHYSELKARGQEANEQAIATYRYLARIVLEKNPSDEDRKVLESLLYYHNVY